MTAHAITAEAKVEFGLAARACLKGWELVKLGDESFIARKWGNFRVLGDLGEAKRFVERLESAT